MSYVTRSRVIGTDGTVIAILPTWSDGAVVALARPDLSVENGEWLGPAADAAPAPTHRSGHAFLRELGQGIIATVAS